MRLRYELCLWPGILFVILWIARALLLASFISLRLLLVSQQIKKSGTKGFCTRNAFRVRVPILSSGKIDVKTIKVIDWTDIPDKFSGVVEWPDGTKRWYLNSEYHRVDGPAAEYPDGRKEHWIHSKYIKDENAYWLLVNMMKLKGLI